VFRFAASLVVATLAVSPVMAQSPGEGKDVETLLKQLKAAGSWSDALRAVRELGPRARPAVPLLLQAAGRGDCGVQTAAQALAAIGPTATLDLVQGLRDANALARAAAVKALGYLRPRQAAAVKPLRGALSDKSDLVRLEAARALWYLKQPAAELVPTLCAILVGEDDGAAAQAAILLGELGPDAKHAVPVLAMVLEHGQGAAPSAAGHALEEIGIDAAAVPAMLRILQRTDTPENKARHWHAARLLSHFSPDIIPGLLVALKDVPIEEPTRQRFTFDKRRDPPLPWSYFGGEAVAPLLRALHDPDVKVRRQAARALGFFDARAIAGLRKALADRDSEVRFWAAFSLVKHGAGEKQFVQLVNEFLVQNPKRAGAAIAMLAEMAQGRPEAARALGALLDGKYQVEALDWLHRLREQAAPATEQIVKFFNRSDVNQQYGMCSLLIFLPEATEAAPALRKMLTSDDESTRQEALEALAVVDPASEATLAAVAGLLRKAEKRNVRTAAIGVVGRAGPKGKALVPELIACLRKGHNYDVAHALAAIGPEAAAAIPALDAVARTVSPYDRIWFAEVLAKLGQEPADQAALLLEIAAAVDWDAVVKIAGHLQEQGPATLAWCRKALAADDPRRRVAAAAVLACVKEDADRAFAALADLLEHESAGVRADAAQHLGRFGGKGVPLLQKALVDPAQVVRLTAVAALADALPGALPALRTALANPDAEVRLNAAQALAGVPGELPRCAPVFTAALVGLDQDQRERVLTFLAESALMTPELEQALVLALGDDDAYVRFRAATILGNGPRPGKHVAPALLAALKDRNRHVRVAAADALSKVDRRATQAITILLAALLDDSGITGKEIALLPNLQTREGPWEMWFLDTPGHPGRSLIRFGAAAVPALVDALTDPALNEGSNGGEPRALIAMLLGLIGPEARDAARALEVVLRTERGHVRHEARLALVRIGAKTDVVVPSLIESLRAQDKGNRGGPVQRLMGNRWDIKSTWLADDLAYQLGLIGPDAGAAVPLLREIAGKRDSPCRLTSCIALWRVTRSPTEAAPLMVAALKALVNGTLASNGPPEDEPAFLDALAEVGPEARAAVPLLMELLPADKDGYRHPLAEKAALALAGIGPDAKPALPLLRDAVKDKNATMPLRLAALRAQWRIEKQPAAVVGQARAILTEPEEQDWAAGRVGRDLLSSHVLAARLLGEIGSAAKTATAELMITLQSLNAFARVAAAEALCKVEQQPDGSLSMLMEMLSHGQTEVRLEALAALTRLGPMSKGALPAIRAALDDAEPAVRAAATVTLQKVK
jgi:HEAT repeat protein